MNKCWFPSSQSYHYNVAGGSGEAKDDYNAERQWGNKKSMCPPKTRPEISGKESFEGLRFQNLGPVFFFFFLS